MAFKKIKILMPCFCLILVGAFVPKFTPTAFSSENVSMLETQGLEAFSKHDFDRLLLIGQKILSLDPHSLVGYQFTLLFSFDKKNLAEALYDCDKAIRQGAPPEIILMKAMFLYDKGLPQFSIVYLLEYENEWSKKHVQSP